MSFFQHVQSQAEAFSTRLNHYYLGVEHLFMALLSLENSLTAAILRQHQLSPEFVQYLIEENLGQSPARRYWEGYRNTPRYDKVLEIAQSYANPPGERELLLAILDDGDNVVVRVLQEAGADLDSLSESASNWSGDLPPTPPHYPTLQTDLPLPAAEKSILQEIYQGQEQLSIDHDYPQAVYHLYSVKNSLVRFDHKAQILHEKRRYDSYLAEHSRTRLDAIHIGEKQHIGAVRYTPPTTQWDDLPTYIQKNGLTAFAGLLAQGIYEHMQPLYTARTERYRFALWREYEAALPPALLVEAERTETEHHLHPLAPWSHDDHLTIGSTVTLNDFTVYDIAPHRGGIVLSAGHADEAVNQSSKVLVLQLPANKLNRYARGQSLRRMRGYVTNTRKHLLMEQVQATAPPFALSESPIETPFGALPNPILALPKLLAQEIDGYFTTIHGSLDFSSVLVGADGTPIFINFTQTRFGHVLYDWATLELAILEHIVAPSIAPDWAHTWEAAFMLWALLRGEISQIQEHDALASAAEPLLALRGVIKPMLESKQEYEAPLCCLALGRLNSPSATLAARRLWFAWAALAAAG